MNRRRFILTGLFASAGAWMALDYYDEHLPENRLTDIFKEKLEISYSEFMAAARSNSLTDVYVRGNQAFIRGENGREGTVTLLQPEKIYQDLGHTRTRIWFQEDEDLIQTVSRSYIHNAKKYGPAVVGAYTGWKLYKDINQEIQSRKFRANIDEDEHVSTANHEAGHALATILKPGFYELGTATIVAGHGYLGMVIGTPPSKFKSWTHDMCLNELVILMSGREAEKLVRNGDYSIGATNDHWQAKNLARMMVAEWGMSKAVGPINHGGLFSGWRGYIQRAFLSKEALATIDDEVTRILKEAEQESARLLAEHQPELRSLAAALLEKKTLEPEEMRAIVLGATPVAAVPAPSAT